ncbi:hypothetical protein Tco_0568474, partial [Tanacetum coccineum]
MAQVHLLQSQKQELEHQKAAAKAETTSLKAKPSSTVISYITTLLFTSGKAQGFRFSSKSFEKGYQYLKQDCHSGGKCITSY